MTIRAKEVAEQIASRLLGQPIHYLRDSQPLHLNEAASLIQLQLTTERNAALREAAETAIDHKLRGKDQTAAGFYNAILALIKEGEGE